MAVVFRRETSLEIVGPGTSARMIYIVCSLFFGRNASTKTSTPMPPIQCVKLRQKSRQRDSASISVRIVAPVVVKPETVSKKQSIKDGICPDR